MLCALVCMGVECKRCERGLQCWVSMCGAWRDELLLTFLYCDVGDAVDSPSFLSPELVFVSSTAVASATCKLSVVAVQT